MLSNYEIKATIDDTEKDGDCQFNHHALQP